MNKTLKQKLRDVLELVENEFMTEGMHTMEIAEVVEEWLASLNEATAETDRNQ